MEAVINLVLYHTLAIHTPTWASIIEVSQPNPLIRRKDKRHLCMDYRGRDSIFWAGLHHDRL